MKVTLLADGVENPANQERIEDAARLLGVSRCVSPQGRLIAVENAKGAGSIYGRKPLREDATLAVGNERRGVSERLLSEAHEIIAIPTQSRTIKALNVAAAAAVAGWYVLRGSRAQVRSTQPEHRRPAVLIIGDEHVEVGSSLRSAAAFGYRDVLLEDRGAGWFDGPAEVRREAFAAARRHKNALRVHGASLEVTARFEEIIFVAPWGSDIHLQRRPLARGRRQLVVIGASPEDVAAVAADRTTIATLGLEPMDHAPLRLVASIALAEIARQVGGKRPMPGRPAVQPPAYDDAISLVPEGEVLVVEESCLVQY
jgi:hypothetical protein